MSNKKPRVILLRGIRKTSNLSGKLAHRTNSFMGRVERKTNRLIIRETGSPSKDDSILVDSFFYGEYPHLFPVHPALPNIGQVPSVTVFVPSLVPRGFFGGIATLLITSATLANKLNYDFRVVQTSGFEKNAKVLEFLKDNGIIIKSDRFHTIDISFRNIGNFAYIPLHPKDVIVVSAWWDAHIASQLPLNKKFLYMLQDYEPIFYNNGDSQQFAENTYHTNKFAPICNTKLMYDYFKGQGYEYIAKNSSWFEPAVGTDSILLDSKKERTLFLYGRPQVSRNMFFTAIKALDGAFRNDCFKQNVWKIYSAGQADIPNIKLSSGHVIKNLGKMDIDKYYKFMKSVSIALSPMLAPHPNYPTLEFASAGSIVVTTKYMTKKNLDCYSSNILLCSPTIQDMTKTLIKAGNLYENGKLSQANNISHDWQKALGDPLDTIIKRFNYV